MPLHAKDITLVPPPAPPAPPDVSHHVTRIDALLAEPWHPSELVDGHGDYDHAGRVYPELGHALSTAEASEIARIYRDVGWEIRSFPAGRLCFVPRDPEGGAPDVDARVLKGFSLHEATYVWNTRGVLKWSEDQITLADLSLWEAVRVFGFPDRATVEAFTYPHATVGPLPTPRNGG